MLEAGSGVGNISVLLLNSERLVLVDCDPMYISRLKGQFGQRANLRVIQADLTDPDAAALWKDETIDTVLCSNVLEHLGPDEQVLRSFQETLVPGGHCVIIVPAGMWLYTGLDEALDHKRRYSDDELRRRWSARDSRSCTRGKWDGSQR